jgi:hypothetical protein
MILPPPFEGACTYGYEVPVGGHQLLLAVSFEGWLDRFDLVLKAEVGEPVRIDATWFACPDWPGPMVVGWKGGLERVRFAVDPSEERFYFGRL